MKVPATIHRERHQPAAMLAEFDCQGGWHAPRSPQPIVLQSVVMRQEVRLPRSWGTSGAGFGWPAKGIVPRLRAHPAEVQKLSRFRQAVAEVPQIGIKVLPIDFDL